MYFAMCCFYVLLFVWGAGGLCVSEVYGCMDVCTHACTYVYRYAHKLYTYIYIHVFTKSHSESEP